MSTSPKFERGTVVKIDKDDDAVVLAGPDSDGDYVVAERDDAMSEASLSGWDVEYIHASRLSIPPAPPVALKVGDIVRVLKTPYDAATLQPGAFGRVVEVGMTPRTGREYVGLDILTAGGVATRPVFTQGWNFPAEDVRRMPAPGETVTVACALAEWNGPAVVQNVSQPGSVFGFGFHVKPTSGPRGGRVGFFSAARIVEARA